jgi:hypothetical protein
MISTKEGKGNSSILLKIILALVVIFFVYFVVISAILLSFLSYENKKLLSYEEIRDGLANGNKIRIVMDYTYMDYYVNGTKKETPDEKSAFDLQQYQYFARQSIGNELEYIITSFTTFVYHPIFKSILDYGKIRIYENQKYEISVYFLDADTFAIIEYKILNGTLAKGGLSFFQQSPKLIKYL